MRPQKIQDEDMIARIAKVFRDKGYEGTSLNDLAKVTGLKKASLYYRFPDGKKEMAESVLKHLNSWVENNIFSSFMDKNVQPALRLKNGLYQTKVLYSGGEEMCILRALSMQPGILLFEQQIKEGIHKWIDVFTEIGLAFKLSVDQAKEYAVKALVEIQGSLIISRGLNSTDVFENAINTIENRYLNL